MSMQEAAERSPRAEREWADGFRPDIEGLRGVAVALVVAYHLGITSTPPWSLRGGFVGVDVFFVISGYLITRLLLTESRDSGRVSLARFYARRARRILPAALAVILITAPLALWLANPLLRASTMEDAASAAVSVANLRMGASVDYLHPVSQSPFLHYWSLGVEEQFYLCWPILLAMSMWRGSRLGPVALLGVIAALSMVLNLVVTASSPAWAFYLLPTRAWQLAIGGLAAALPQLARGPRAFRSATGWAGLLAILWAALFLDPTVAYPGVAALPPTLGAAALVWFGGPRWGPAPLLGCRPLRMLGRISYSLYLWHWPVLVLGAALIGGPGDVPVDPLAPVTGLALVGCSVVVASLSWRFIEEPFRRFRLKSLRPSRVVGAGVGAMGLTGALCIVLASSVPIPVPQIPQGSDPQRLAIQGVTTAAPSQPLEPSSLGLEIQPTVTAARRDVEETITDGCLVGFSETVPPKNCVFGNRDSTYTLALVGDSHASALFPAIQALAVSRGWRLETYLKTSCRVSDVPIYNSYLKREYTECEVWNRNVLRVLGSHPPDLIIAANRRIMTPIDPSQNNVQSLAAGMSRMLAAMPAGSRKVIVIDVPSPGRNVPECLAANPDDIRRCDYPRTTAFEDSYGVTERAAATSSGAGLIDLTDQICPGDDVCPVIIGKTIVWRDEQHLTATFSRALYPSIDRQLALDVTGQRG